MSLWQTLKKPIFILAPMEDVTDTVFRQTIVTLGRPDLFFTEFTNVEGMRSVGEKIVAQRLQFEPQEHPIVAQIWGKEPHHFFDATNKIIELGFDGVDINMGCPEKSVVKNGCCAALIKNKELAHEIIQRTLEAAQGSAGKPLPVSVKTRIGFGEIVTEEWISFLLSHPIDALTIHGRTAKEESKVPCHWDEIGKAVTIRNQLHSKTLIIGNGDVLSKAEGVMKANAYGVDGIMIGRGIFTNPFLFSDQPDGHTNQEYLELLVRHVTLYTQTWGTRKPYPVLKKYFKIYVANFSGASELRAELMETTQADEAIRITTHFMENNQELLKEVRTF